MLGSRRVREVTCPSCAARWPRRTSRFCGACGASLPDSTAGVHLTEDGPPDEDELAGDRRFGLSSRRLELIAAAVLVVIVGVAITVAASVSEPPLDTDSDHVELPAPDELPDDGRDAPPEGAPQDREPASEGPRSNDVPLHGPGTLTCVPAGCERWRIELPDGSVTPTHDLLIHVERKVGPPTDWPDEGREEPSRDFTVLTALDPSDGRIVWERQLEKPHLTEPGVQVQVLPVDESLVLVLWGREIFALEAPTGERRWGTFRAPAARPDRPGVDGEVVVWWPDAAGNGGDHLDQPDAGPSLTAPSGALISLDRRSGAAGWRIATRLLTSAHGQAVVLSADGTEVSGIDLDDRTTTWSRELRSGLSHPPVPLAGRRLALPSHEGIEVIGTDSGDTIADRRLGLSPRRHIEVVGTTLVQHAPGDRPEEADPRTRSSVLLLDLADPDVAPRQIDDVTSVVTLRSPAPVAAPPWHERPVEGLVITTQPEDQVHLTVLDASGSVRFEGDTGLSSEACCWQPVPSDDPGSIALVDPDADGSRVAIVPTTHQQEPRIISLPADRTINEVLGDDAGFVVAHGRGGVGHDLWLVADEARASVIGGARVVTVDPVPVIQTAEGLIGLDLGQRSG